MSASTRRLPFVAKALAAIIFAALLFVGMPVPSAHAATEVDITIKVTTKTGAGLPGLKVYAYPIENHAIVGDGITAANPAASTYTLRLDTAKHYTFYFDAPGTATTAFDQFYGGTTWPEEAQSYTPTRDATLNLTLATNSTITGKVTGLSSKALAGVSVYPWRFDGNRWFRIAGAVAVTGSTGVYTMRNLEPGTYRLEFAPDNTTGYLREYSGNTTVRDNAQKLNVGLGSTISYNAALGTGGSLTGSVKIRTKNAEGVWVQFIPDGVTAYVFRADPLTGAIDTSEAFLSKPTGDSGKWTVPGLPAGTYKVKLYDTKTSAWVDVWADNVTGAANASGAAIYTVAIGKTTTAAGYSNLDFFDDLADTSLEIVALDRNGDPLGPDADVYIESASGEDFYYQSGPDSGLENGHLHFLFLPVGTYRIWIDPHDGISQPYVETWPIVAGDGGNTWNIELDPVSAFAYSLPATVSHGSTAVGSLNSVTRGHTTLDDGTGLQRPVEYTYLWLRDGNPIFGAQSTTSSTYTTRGPDLGHQISLIVRAEAFGYQPVFTVLDVVVPTQAPAPQSDAGDPPTVSGPAAPVPGSVLTAKAGTWSPTGAAFVYQWLRDGAEIPGAVGRTYMTTVDDAGHGIGFTIAAAKPGYATSAPIASADTVTVGFAAAPKLTKASVAKITAIPDGIRVAASPGTWSPAPTGYEYRWRVGDVALTTTVPTFDCTAPACDSTNAIQLTVVAKRTGYADGQRAYLVRKGTTPPGTTSAGFVYDATDGGHPSFDATTDPAQIGHVLRAWDPEYSYPGAGGGTVTRAYQWQRKSGSTWANISKATKVTYVPTTSDLNRELRLRIITTSTLYPTMTAYATAGTARYRFDLVNGSHPTVSVAGTELAGTTKRAILTGSWSVTGVAQSYQWYSCAIDCSDPTSRTWVAIAKATSWALTPSSAYNGKQLMVRLVGSKSGYQPVAIYSGALSLDAGADPDQVAAFTMPGYASGLVSGQAVVGRTIAVTPATLDRTAGVTRSYLWTVCDDVACTTPSPAGSTTTKITPAGDLLADGQPHWIRLTESISVDGHVTTLEATPIPLVAGTWAPAKAPSLITQANNPAPGQTTWTVAGTWPAGVDVEYEWHRGTTLLGGSAAFTQGPGTEPIWVEVTATRTGYAPLTYKLVARKGTFPAQATALSGARYGDVLSLATPVTLPLTAPAPSVSYQWYLGTKAIKGATKATFVPGTTYIGKTVRLRVAVASPYYATAAYYSARVTVGYHLPATGTPTIVSTPATFAPGARLTVSATGYPSGMAYGYTWQRSTDGGSTWSNLSAASSYVLTAADAGAQVRVLLRATRTGWTASSIASAARAVNYSAPLALTAPFLLSTPPKVDVPLVAATTWNTTGYTLAYSWTRNGVTIPGATTSTITPTASWFGDELQGHVTATKPGYVPVSVESNTVVVLAGNAPVGTGVGIARSGDVLTASTGIWSVAGVTLSFRWYASTAPSTLAGTEATFDIASYPAGTTFTVHVDAARTGYQPGSATQTARK